MEAKRIAVECVHWAPKRHTVGLRTILVSLSLDAHSLVVRVF